MYEQHFGFSRALFCNGMAQDEDVFKTTAITQLIQDLEVALTRRDSVAVISGQSGTGKTTVAADSLKNIDTQLAFASISQPPVSQSELLEQLLTDFGLEPQEKSRVERLQLWRQFLTEMGATGTRVSLLIENSDGWSHEVLQGLHSLTAADADLSPGANIVFTCCAPAEDLLSRPELVGLSQRVRLRRRIEPLTPGETKDYIAFKCRRAGASADAIFPRDFATALYEFSGGIIRVMDNLLESALISAATGNKSKVTAEVLANVAVRQFGISVMPPASVATLLQEVPPATIESRHDTDEIPILTDVVSLKDEYDPAEVASAN